MIKLLILVLLVFVGYSLLQGLLRPGPGSGQSAPRNRSREGEEMVEDPQCGTFVPRGDAISSRIDGQQYYFCSQKCLKEFKKQRK